MCRWHAKDEALDADKDWACDSGSGSGSNSAACHTSSTDPMRSENQLREAFYLTFDLVSKNFN